MTGGLGQLIGTYGYGLIAFNVMVQCAGVPFPGEATMIASAIYAATTGHLDIAWVIAAACLGAIAGNFVGYQIGHRLGAKMLARHGWRVGLTERRLAIGRYLFRKHGGKIVVSARFVTGLRSFIPLMAGAQHMPWGPFAWASLVGGIAWPVAHGSFYYLLGHAAHDLPWPYEVGLIACICGGLWASVWFAKRNELRLGEAARRSEAYGTDI